MALTQCAARSKYVKRSMRRPVSASRSFIGPLARKNSAIATSTISSRPPPYGMSQLLRTWRQASPAVVYCEPGYWTKRWISTPASGASLAGRLL
ncbi:Uncharacterised protein [Bordetella pertussis]|nr:Uncharacterised protein [Bordetella pertussis]